MVGDKWPFGQRYRNTFTENCQRTSNGETVSWFLSIKKRQTLTLAIDIRFRSNLFVCFVFHTFHWYKDKLVQLNASDSWRLPIDTSNGKFVSLLLSFLFRSSFSTHPGPRLETKLKLPYQYRNKMIVLAKNQIYADIATNRNKPQQRQVKKKRN